MAYQRLYMPLPFQMFDIYGNGVLPYTFNTIEVRRHFTDDGIEIPLPPFVEPTTHHSETIFFKIPYHSDHNNNVMEESTTEEIKTDDTKHNESVDTHSYGNVD